MLKLYGNAYFNVIHKKNTIFNYLNKKFKKF